MFGGRQVEGLEVYGRSRTACACRHPSSTSPASSRCHSKGKRRGLPVHLLLGGLTCIIIIMVIAINIDISIITINIA